MSDKEENLPGRQDSKAANRIKKKKRKPQAPAVPEGKEAVSEAAKKEKAPSPSSLQGLTSPKSISGSSEPKGALADEAAKADKGKALSGGAPEEAVFARTTSEEESSVLEKSPNEAVSSEPKEELADKDIGASPASEMADSESNAEAAARAPRAGSTSPSSEDSNTPIKGSAPAASEYSASSAGNGYGKLRLWLRVLAIGLIVIAVGNAYYARMLADREREARQALAEKLAEQLAAQVETHVDSQLEERLAEREESFREVVTHLAKENKRHAEEFGEVQEKIATLESTLGVLRTEAQMSPEAEDWDIAEVAYLLRIANERLQLERDVKTTLVALQAADQILRKAADPALTPVRSQLAEEINALKALPTPDIGGMALSLSNLVERVGDLEFKETVVEETAAVAETQTTDEAASEEDDAMAKARRFLNFIWDDLKHLVMVRRRGKGDEGLPILLPEERYFLYRNLELELESARLSLLRSDEEGFRQGLHLAQNWLQTYFQGTEAEVMQNTLAELAQTSIRPPLPNISGSLKTLNRVWKRTRS